MCAQNNTAVVLRILLCNSHCSFTLVFIELCSFSKGYFIEILLRLRMRIWKKSNGLMPQQTKMRPAFFRKKTPFSAFGFVFEMVQRSTCYPYARGSWLHTHMFTLICANTAWLTQHTEKNLIHCIHCVYNIELEWVCWHVISDCVSFLFLRFSFFFPLCSYCSSLGLALSLSHTLLLNIFREYN